MTNPQTDDPIATLERLLKESAPGPFQPYSGDDEFDFEDEHFPHGETFRWLMDADGKPVAKVIRPLGVAFEPPLEFDATFLLLQLAPALVEVAKAAREDLAARNTGDPDWSLAREARANNALVAALRALEVKP